MKHFKILKTLILAFCALFVSGLRQQFATANAETAAGTHKALTRRADAAHTYTHLLCKAGSDDQHATFCGAGNYPIGITSDAPGAAEDLFEVTPLGLDPHTRKVRVASALGNDIALYTAANGFAQGEPGIAGTYYRVGRSVAAASQEGSSNYLIEFRPHAPVKVVVIAALTSAQNATTAATDLTTSEALANALKASFNALQTDVAALGTALASPAEVKVLGS